MMARPNRVDAWTETEDVFLTETVIRTIREGKTQLDAFEEVSKRFPDRSPSAAAFRWNSVVRKSCEEQIREAKRIGRANRLSMSLQLKDVREMKAIYEAAERGLNANKACAEAVGGQFNLSQTAIEGIGAHVLD